MIRGDEATNTSCVLFLFLLFSFTTSEHQLRIAFPYPAPSPSPLHFPPLFHLQRFYSPCLLPSSSVSLLPLNSSICTRRRKESGHIATFELSPCRNAGMTNQNRWLQLMSGNVFCPCFQCHKQLDTANRSVMPCSPQLDTANRCVMLCYPLVLCKVDGNSNKVYSDPTHHWSLITHA